MAKKQALGKGLGALLSDAPERVVTVKRTDSPPIIGRMAGNVALLTISQIEANKDQPRKDFDEAPLQELATSLRESWASFSPSPSTKFVRTSTKSLVANVAFERRNSQILRKSQHTFGKQTTKRYSRWR